MYYSFIEPFFSRCNKWIKRAFIGYAPVDVYSYCMTNSERAVILLTKLRDVYVNSTPTFVCDPGCGNPCTCNGRSKWESILTDIIFYHSCIAQQYEEFDPEFNCMLPSESLSDIIDPEKKKQFRRGRFYYMKYYSSLWD